MLLRRPTPALAAVAVVAGLLAVPAAASAAPDQELPFSCAEQWTGTTRANHRPSSLSVDFNRESDSGRAVVASARGVVSRVEDEGNRSYGKWIKIDHAEGYSTIYAHLATQWVVPGQFVDQGAPIGRVGATGGVTGAHLHFEQRLGNVVQRAVFHQAALVYRRLTASLNCPDVPLAGDWNGDHADEVAVFRRDAGAGSFELYSPEGAVPVRLGGSSDLPVVGDWDGDGVTDLGVRRLGTRLFLLRAADGSLTRKKLGLVKDVPVTGDWDGDGVTDLGLWRPASLSFRLLRADGSLEVIRFGGPGSEPVTGDWDGDGVTDVGVFDAAIATFQLRTVSADGQVSYTPVQLGTSTDLPVTGDWNGDRVSDVGVWTPGTATYTMRVTPTPASARRSRKAPAELRTLAFGRPR
jgi:hypothetical protein